MKQIKKITIPMVQGTRTSESVNIYEETKAIFNVYYQGDEVILHGQENMEGVEVYIKRDGRFLMPIRIIDDSDKVDVIVKEFKNVNEYSAYPGVEVITAKDITFYMTYNNFINSISDRPIIGITIDGNDIVIETHDGDIHGVMYDGTIEIHKCPFKMPIVDITEGLSKDGFLDYLVGKFIDITKSIIMYTRNGSEISIFDGKKLDTAIYKNILEFPSKTICKIEVILKDIYDIYSSAGVNTPYDGGYDGKV